MPTKTATFALVKRHGWLVIDRVARGDGDPWFLGVEAGFDVRRVLVYADNGGDALEIAEERYPEIMGKKVPEADEDEVEASGRGTFFGKGRLWVQKDVRIFGVAERVETGEVLPGGDARLKNGETVRYT